MQRVTEEELHRHPPGSSLRVRGPRQLSAAAFRRPDRDPQAVQHNEMLEDMGRADPQARPCWDGQNARDHVLLAATSALGHERPAAIRPSPAVGDTEGKPGRTPR
ncbi:hypothetical protein [Streptomyces sp. FT1]|uniref:hypothetical protein n=1 Tax=Streptomyces sp. FT1 TaxID=2871486 RepID=UPI002255798D|nr:hypothetical protein [Streptomyces sp. FT1]MCX5460584.1 hypothetical protein [Streptomyces sp. FT1]